ncbi:MAG: KH domain-containing protein [Deferribacterales bacterium]
MKELVEFIVKSLVDKPDSVSITEVEGEKASILELRVDQADLGKVIGKQGRTAKAIRTILNASGVKSGKKTVLEILD